MQTSSYSKRALGAAKARGVETASNSEAEMLSAAGAADAHNRGRAGEIVLARAVSLPRARARAAEVAARSRAKSFARTVSTPATHGRNVASRMEAHIIQGSIRAATANSLANAAEIPSAMLGRPIVQKEAVHAHDRQQADVPSRRLLPLSQVHATSETNETRTRSRRRSSS